MRRRVWFGFGVFCLLSGSTWLRQYLLPSAWPELLQVAVHDGLVCPALAAIWLAGRQPWPAWRKVLEAGCWAAALFVAAPLLAAGAAFHMQGATGVLVLALIPALTVFVEAQRGRLEGLGLLLPALAALGGLALLVPFALPVSAVGWAWLVGLVAGALLLAAGGVRLQGLMRGLPVLPVAIAGSGFAALLALAGWRVSQPRGFSTVGLFPELAWGVAVDGTLAVLTVWLARELTPAAFSGRFVLIPWVTLMGGLALTRVSPGWVPGLGLVLALGGSVALAVAAREQAGAADSRPDLQGTERLSGRGAADTLKGNGSVDVHRGRG